MRNWELGMRNVKRVFLAVACFITLVFSASSQERAINFDTSVSVNWARGELSGQAGFNLAQAGFRLPTGRFQGEETLRQAYPQLLQPYLLSLRVDSSSTVRDLVDRREISLEDLYYIAREAGRGAPHLSTDLSRMTSRFTVGMDNISELLLRYRTINEPMRPLIPVQAPIYTGIIIIATDEL